MSVIWQGLLTGVCLGGTYALITIGFSLFYQSAGVLNLAHGYIVMIAGVILASIMPSLPRWTALPLGIGLGGGLSVLLFVLFVRPVLNRGPWFLMFVTLGVSFLAVGLVQTQWGSNSQTFDPLIDGQMSIFGAVLRIQQLFALAVAVLITAAITWLIKYTMLGRALQAAAEEPEGAATVGIDAKHMMLIAALISGGLAGLSAALIVPDVGVDPRSGDFLTLIAVTAAVIGGLGNVWGAVGGGMALGIVNGLSSGLAPRWFEVLEFSLLLLVLVYRAANLKSRHSTRNGLAAIVEVLFRSSGQPPRRKVDANVSSGK